MEPAPRPLAAPAPPASDRDAFDRLATAAMPRLLGSARRILGDDRAAEEAVAEALFLAWRRIDGFRGESLFGTWVHRILFRAIADRYRAEARDRARNRRSVEARRAPPPPSPVGLASAREDRARLRAATERLAPAQRLVLLLVVWEGLSLEDAAEVLGMRYRTVKSNLHHARRSLERLLGESAEGGTP